MVVMEFSFTARRFHAGPGPSDPRGTAVEWPPSPWRILGTLAAVWRRAMPEAPASDLTALITALAPPPVYSLPEHATIGRTARRGGTGAGRSPGPSLDAFVALDPRDTRVFAVWSAVRLEHRLEDLLDRLLDHIPYLGEPDSWCRARRLVEPWVPEDRTINCRPRDAGDDPSGGQITEVLCIDPAFDAASFLIAADAAPSRRSERDAPPGSALRLYTRPPLSPPTPLPVASPSLPPRAEAIRYSLRAASPATGHDGSAGESPGPSVLQTLRVGDLARTAAMARFGRTHGGGLSPSLSGRGAGGAVVEQQHRHAHYLGTDEDGDGLLDHLTVWAPGGLAPHEVAVLLQLEELREPGSGGALRLRLSLLQSGPETILPPLLRGPARLWRSVTPFVLTRHPKRRPPSQGGTFKSDSPLDQLLAELRHRGRFPASVQPEEVPPHGYGWLDFHRHRRSQRPPVEGAYGFRLEFGEPVTGPIALGFGAHHGLGLFAPVDDSPTA